MSTEDLAVMSPIPCSGAIVDPKLHYILHPIEYLVTILNAYLYT